MTTEEKAKAYDEALERAKKYNIDDAHAYQGTIVKLIFPELRESEDERIRKALINALKVSETIGELEFRLSEPTKEKAIAYLEKQKEASKAIEAVERIDKYIDEHVENAHDMKDSHPDKKYCQGIDDTLAGIAGILQDVYSGVLRESMLEREQKPKRDIVSSDAIESCMLRYLQSAANRKDDIEIIEDTKAYKSELISIIEKEQKPEWNKVTINGEPIPTENQSVDISLAKWSEEDSDNLERVDNYLWMLDNYVGDDCATPQGKADKIRGNIQEILSPWLKSLPERFNLQPKQEWSEEDESCWNLIWDVLDGPFKASPDGYRKAADWFIKNCPKGFKALPLNLKKKNEDVAKLCSNEWSEEDEKMLEAVDESLYCYESGKAPEMVAQIEAERYWLQSLSLNLKKKNEDVAKLCSNEWNEEDEKKITFLERLIRYNVPEGQYGWVDGHKGGFVTKLEAISMLKSLKPSWKPTEHQMSILKAVKEYVGKGSGYWGEGLGSLIDDLEKLM